eukprot:5443593-Lingulodinium_polyedra.AAC.1
MRSINGDIPLSQDVPALVRPNVRPREDANTKERTISRQPAKGKRPQCHRCANGIEPDQIWAKPTNQTAGRFCQCER